MINMCKLDEVFVSRETGYPGIPDAISVTELILRLFPHVVGILQQDAAEGNLDERLVKMIASARKQASTSDNSDLWKQAADQMSHPEYRRYLAARLGLV